jgi:hypothetical protein
MVHGVPRVFDSPPGDYRVDVLRRDLREREAARLRDERLRDDFAVVVFVRFRLSPRGDFLRRWCEACCFFRSAAAASCITAL